MFGHMLSRLFHYIVQLRQEVPDTIIWLRKEGFKSTYRHIHHKADMALKSVVRLEIEKSDLLLVSLQLPFGGSPCPPDFCLFSDVITDAINDLLSDESWDHKSVCSDFVQKIPTEISLSKDVPFAEARELSVEYPRFRDEFSAVCDRMDEEQEQ